MKYCEEYAALLDLYVDGELAGEEAARVRDHLEGCPGCQSYVDGALAIRAAFPEAEETAVPEGFAEGVMAAVRVLENGKKAETGPAGGKAVRWKRVLLPLAACFAIVLAVRYGPSQGGSFSAADNAAAPAAMDTAASSGGEDAADAAAPYGLAEAAPQPDAASAPEEYSLAAAPAPRIVPGGDGDDPAASASADGSAADGAVPYDDTPDIEEAGKTVLTTASSEELCFPRMVRLTAEQAGELLAELPCTAGGDGVRRYQLTREEFDALLAALAERDIYPLEEVSPETEILPQGYDLVYVTED